MILYSMQEWVVYQRKPGDCPLYIFILNLTQMATLFYVNPIEYKYNTQVRSVMCLHTQMHKRQSKLFQYWKHPQNITTMTLEGKFFDPKRGNLDSCENITQPLQSKKASFLQNHHTRQLIWKPPNIHSIGRPKVCTTADEKNNSAWSLYQNPNQPIFP